MPGPLSSVDRIVLLIMFTLAFRPVSVVVTGSTASAPSVPT